MRTYLVVALLACLALAGCTGQDSTMDTDIGHGAGEEDLAGQGTPPREEPREGQPDPSPAPQPTSASRAAAEDVVKEHKLDLEGKLPAGAGSPQFGMANTGMLTGMERWFSERVKGDVVGANITLTWDAASVGTERLRLSLSPVEACMGGGGECMTDEARHVHGTSPLTIQLDGLDWRGRDYVVAAWWSGEAAAALEQPFSIAGQILHE